MSAIANRVIRFLRQEDGPTAVEYAVMLALMDVCVVSNSVLGQQTNDTFSSARAELKAAVS